MPEGAVNDSEMAVPVLDDTGTVPDTDGVPDDPAGSVLLLLGTELVSDVPTEMLTTGTVDVTESVVETVDVCDCTGNIVVDVAVVVVLENKPGEPGLTGTPVPAMTWRGYNKSFGTKAEMVEEKPNMATAMTAWD